MDFALTLRSLTSTLLPVRTMGMFSQTRTRSPEEISLVVNHKSEGDVRCQLGTFLYVIREVTSNMMIPHWPLM
jgi:hypothetical protein